MLLELLLESSLTGYLLRNAKISTISKEKLKANLLFNTSIKDFILGLLLQIVYFSHLLLSFCFFVVIVFNAIILKVNFNIGIISSLKNFHLGDYYDFILIEIICFSLLSLSFLMLIINKEGNILKYAFCSIILLGDKVWLLELFLTLSISIFFFINGQNILLIFGIFCLITRYELKTQQISILERSAISLYSYLKNYREYINEEKRIQEIKEKRKIKK